MRCVQEEAGHHTVPFSCKEIRFLTLTCLLRIDIDEFSGYHREIVHFVTGHCFGGADIRDLDLQECLILRLQVAESVNERVDIKLFLAVSLIEDPVASEKHKVSELIPLRLVAFESEIEYQAAHPTPRV